MKLVFFGTPDFAVPCLERLSSRTDVEIVAVVTQPDRARDRGRVTFSPVKEAALRLGLPVLQYERIKLHVDEVRALGADLGVTCAYGQILNQELLDAFPHGIINVHGSLLPAYRGSSPIQWAVINGESKTGVTVMQTALGVDSGDMLLQRELEILPEETAGELFDRLSQFAPDVLSEALDGIIQGTVTRTPQDESKATHFPMLTKTTGAIDLTCPARAIVNLVRGVNPWPGAYLTMPNGEILKVHCARVAEGHGEPGEVLAADRNCGLVVACGDGAVRLCTVQRAGKRPMSDCDYLCGNGIAVGKRLC